MRNDISTIGHANAVYAAAGPHLNTPEQLAENIRKFNLAKMMRFGRLTPVRTTINKRTSGGFAKRPVEASV